MRRILIAILLLTFQSTVMAATAVCVGTIATLSNSIYSGETGTFSIQLNNTSFIRICSFDTQFFRTSPSGCKHIASMAAMAYMNQNIVNITIDNAPGTDCSSIGAWFGADVRHIYMTK